MQETHLNADAAGVALGTAALGAQLRVRLANALHPDQAGRVIEVTATAPGEVLWLW